MIGVVEESGDARVAKLDIDSDSDNYHANELRGGPATHATNHKHHQFFDARGYMGSRHSRLHVLAVLVLVLQLLHEEHCRRVHERLRSTRHTATTSGLPAISTMAANRSGGC